MQKFKDMPDDSAYTAAHPDGYVINAPKEPSTIPLKLHIVRCSHISTPKRPNYTTKHYYKMCSEDRGELTLWARDEGNLEPCGHCRPDGSY